MTLTYTMTEFCNFNFTQGYRTPPEELGPHHMMHPHQASQFQGIPQLPQYDPKILQNAPKELMRGISYPIPDEEPYIQGKTINGVPS